MAFEKIKRSPRKHEIQKMLSEGISPRKIANWLKKQGESISYLLIHQYKQQEFNFTAAAVAEMELESEPQVESQNHFESGKRSVMNDIEFCNRVITISEEKLSEATDDPLGHAQFKTFSEAAFKAIEVKRKIAEGGQRESANIYVDFKQLKIEVARELERIEELEAIEAKEVGT